jgi:hypothetical protein
MFDATLALLLMLSSALPQEPLRVPATPGQPAPRRAEPGEQQTEGLLQRVECPRGRPVMFVVKTGDSVARFQAPKLDAVEYIARTADFKGPMTCGGRAAGDPVIVTWRPEKTAEGKTEGDTAGKTAGQEEQPAARRAIAIEFLPKR